MSREISKDDELSKKTHSEDRKNFPMGWVERQTLSIGSTSHGLGGETDLGNG